MKVKEKKEKNEKKKLDKRDVMRKVLAGVLAGFMVLSIAATCIYAIISMIG